MTVLSLIAIDPKLVWPCGKKVKYDLSISSSHLSPAWAASYIITPACACRARRHEVSQLAVVMNRLQTAESSFCQGNRRYVNGKSPQSRKEKPITTFSNQHSSFSRHSGARLRVTSERMSEIPSWCSDFDL